MLVSISVNVGPEREEAGLEGDDVRSVHRSRTTPPPENWGIILQVRCVDCWAVREQRQEQDSSPGTWGHCILNPINLANITDSWAFSAGKFVTFRFPQRDYYKVSSLYMEVSKVLCSRLSKADTTSNSSSNTFLDLFPHL